ncbi:MAG: hypothetical protein O7G83_17370 [Proteobacteria bacterium]|nr:hypothetical protein [Pseudomonadota bacterium]
MALTAAGEQVVFVIFGACARLRVTAKDPVKRLSGVANVVTVGWNSDIEG